MSRTRNWTLLFFILSALTPFLIKTNSKNVCSSYFDYFFINFGGNCFYNEDVDLGVPELIQKYTGALKTYNITTQDGYILTTFRIFKKDPIGVVLLQPPISAGAVAYLSDGNYSLGFSLWRKGYDVWLSNHRGASYSRQHVNLSLSDPQFWDFSFHEIALYDLDAQFEVIHNETNSKIIFIGYSMAGTEALIYASLKPEETDRYIDSFVLLAPLTILKHFSSVFRYLLYFMEPFEKILRMGEFPTFEVVRWLARPITAVPYIVNYMASIVMGWTPTEMDPMLYPYVFAHHGRGISNKMIYHYGQIFFNKSDFLMYDYGQGSNKIIYGLDTPPSYPLENLKTSVYLIYGDKDRLSTPIDIQTLSTNFLPKVSRVFAISNHNHIDFMFSRHRRKKTYQTVFKILDMVKNRVKSNGSVENNGFY